MLPWEKMVALGLIPALAHFAPSALGPTSGLWWTRRRHLDSSGQLLLLVQQ